MTVNNVKVYNKWDNSSFNIIKPVEVNYKMSLNKGVKNYIYHSNLYQNFNVKKLITKRMTGFSGIN